VVIRVEQDIRARVVNVTPQGELIPGHLYADFEKRWCRLVAKHQKEIAKRQAVLMAEASFELPLAPRKPRPAAGLSLQKYATRTLKGVVAKAEALGRRPIVSAGALGEDQEPGIQPVVEADDPPSRPLTAKLTANGQTLTKRSRSVLASGP
jgi:hypothetical protein